MKKTLLFFAVIAGTQKGVSQLVPTITAADITAAQALIDGEIIALAPDQVVTNYTFHRIFADEFAEILSVENFSGSAIKYATLKVDGDKSSFAFSPFVKHWGNQQNGEPLKGYFNLSLKGSVNSDEVATLFNSEGFNRKFDLGFNFNWILKGGNFHTMNAVQVAQLRSDQQAITADVAAYYNAFLNPALNRPLSFIENKNALTNVTALTSSFRKKYSEAEEKLAESFWTVKYKCWLATSASIGYQTQSALSVADSERVTLEYVNPAAEVNLNMFWSAENYSIYGSAFVKGSTKNTFSGKDPVSWNQISSINDSTFTISEQKDVYKYNPADYSKEFLPAGGLQAILMFTKIGIDLSFNGELLVKSPVEKTRPIKTTQSYGIIFPIKDKDGDPTINIEVFYSHDVYNVAYLENNDFFGAKFSVPIFSK